MFRNAVRFILLLSIIGGSALTSELAGQEVGLQLYSLRDQFKKDVPGTLDLIQSWGITILEGGDSYGMPPEAFREELRKRNLQVISIGASFTALEKDIEMVIRNARDYGAKYVMCAWIPHEGVFTLEDTRKAIAAFNRAGEALGSSGIQLTYHPHGYEFRSFEGGTLLDYMLQHARYFKFEMDVYWVQHGGEDPLALLNRYPEQFVLMHLKDMAGGVEGNTTGHEDEETNVVLGTGQVDIAKLVARAKELGIPYLFIEDESSRVVEQVPMSLKYLESL